MKWGMTPGRLPAAVELRQSAEGPRLEGVILQEGRAAAGGRAELFTPFSVAWPPLGIDILIGHGGPVAVTVVPERRQNGELRISTPAPAAVVDAVSAGRSGLSVGFRALLEVVTAGGVREIQRAMVEAAALVANPEYQQARAEVRATIRRMRMWQ